MRTKGDVVIPSILNERVAPKGSSAEDWLRISQRLSYGEISKAVAAVPPAEKEAVQRSRNSRAKNRRLPGPGEVVLDAISIPISRYSANVATQVGNSLNKLAYP